MRFYIDVRSCRARFSVVLCDHGLGADMSQVRHEGGVPAKGFAAFCVW